MKLVLASQAIALFCDHLWMIQRAGNCLTISVEMREGKTDGFRSGIYKLDGKSQIRERKDAPGERQIKEKTGRFDKECSFVLGLVSSYLKRKQKQA